MNNILNQVTQVEGIGFGTVGFRKSLHRFKSILGIKHDLLFVNFTFGGRVNTLSQLDAPCGFGLYKVCLKE